jgi:hypothetical protein
VKLFDYKNIVYKHMAIADEFQVCIQLVTFHLSKLDSRDRF